MNSCLNFILNLMYVELPVIASGIRIGRLNLKTKQISIKDSNLINFSCDSRIECCSNLKIPVTEFDITQIEDNGYEIDQIISSFSPILLPSKTISGISEKVYTLKRKPYDGTCTFLENNLCKIHDFKPFACQIYPFSLEVVDESNINILIHQDVFCKSIIPAKLEDSNNINLLEDILDNLMKELEARNIPIN
ncbi:MAG: hypothetical protein HeimC2_09930 [Candidatus Heimdallarchaeota archaeon LC_2]|nr:MAG: hypothetical protein HeimC2_09930 [Candidatus Heimdallarchaeota archaeon LC_2]